MVLPQRVLQPLLLQLGPRTPLRPQAGTRRPGPRVPLQPLQAGTRRPGSRVPLQPLQACTSFTSLVGPELERGTW